MTVDSHRPADPATSQGLSSPGTSPATPLRACSESRLAAIDLELQGLGYRMEPSLSVLDGEGHCVIELASGEPVDPPGGRVFDLAVEWTLLMGGCPEGY